MLLNKKIRNRALIFTILILIILFCSGCADISFSDTALIRPPRTTGDKAEIQDIIIKEAAGPYTLKYPQNGDYRSAIIIYESKQITEYAIALYSTESDSAMNVSILTCNENGWKCVGTFQNSGAGVDRVMFDDINGDKINEIIIGWNSYNSNQKTLTAYVFEQNGVREMTVDGVYDEVVISDITDDGLDDILMLSLSTADVPSTAKLFQYSKQEKHPIGKCSLELDSNITGFSNIIVDKIDKDKKGVIIDGTKSGNILSTQIVYFDNKSKNLVNPLVVKEGGNIVNTTTRKDIVTSRDMDGDGIIEVPVVTQMPAPVSDSSESGSSELVCNITSWKRLSVADNTLTTKLNTVINYTDGYYFIMPDRWNNTVTAKTNPDNREMTFFLWNSNTSSTGDKLLTIYRFTKNEWENIERTNLIYLENVTDGSTGAVFAAQIFNTSAKDILNIKKDEVISSIKSIH